MAFTTTTLSAAVAVNDNSIKVASATGFVAGMLLRVDGEMMKVQQSYASGTTIPVIRGIDGSAVLAHPTSANVTVGNASDFALPPAGVDTGITNPAQPAFPIYSYSAAGGLSPVQGIHIINGTSTLAMTLASPTKDQDGQMMIIVSNGKGAHTVTYTGGVGGGGTGMDVGTFNTTEQTGCILIAVNGVWVLIANGIGSAGTQVAGVVFA